MLYNWLKKFFALVNPMTDEKSVKMLLQIPPHKRRPHQQRSIDQWLRMGRPTGDYLCLVPTEERAQENRRTARELGMRSY